MAKRYIHHNRQDEDNRALPSPANHSVQESESRAPARKKSGVKKPKNILSPLSLQIIPIVLVAIAIFLIICLLFDSSSVVGGVGRFIRNLLLGLFSFGGIFIPGLMVLQAFTLRSDCEKGTYRYKWIVSAFSILTVSVMDALFFSPAEYTPSALWQGGINLTSGGVAGGYVYYLLHMTIGPIGVGILCGVALFILISLLWNVPPLDALKGFGRWIWDLCRGDDIEKETKTNKTTSSKPVVVAEFTDLDTLPSDDRDQEGYGTLETGNPLVIFGDNRENDTAENEPPFNMDPTDEPAPEEDEEEVVFESVSGHPDYRFPPISLLRDEPISGSVDPRDCEAVARKLVETLASFGVRTTLQNISHGPAITRYELLPDVGVRVKSIANLADDISMRLASSGVRIEAPIPGKEAVGIEVPNKKVDIVYVRQLIDTDEFRNAPGKLTTCLGMDVAGKPIFCDLAKMPHLLVAGATGMGKSACINSLLTSILYKATPEEVKLILIDPKKVEFGIFNGLPHLLVPVVTDPRKAAGALCWAVAEMDRRFTLIENMNVRNVQAYNQAIAGNPAAERLPQVVIIIDELADLMMTARDEVEGSICRLAQKARAAGMHLCIATQRPSTDVITGLMKANIPSRIAFTVASQVDSRVIIDMMGAEKLIGRGDMLYSPVGLLKPMRVQGAFITDSEVEAVTDFIRQAVTTEYDDEVMASIEQNAAMCGGKGKKGYDEEENDITEPRITLNDDPLLIRAAELALSQGSIAVSQLQRDLQVGYPRAGALVDKLHKLGVVGAYCGSKPRPITMTYEEFQELRMRQDSKFG